MQDGQPAVGEAAQVRQPSERRCRSSCVTPLASACAAIAEVRTRSAHMPPHQARSSSSAKHQVLDVAVTSVKPAARAQDSRRRPASGSPPLARAIRWYSAIHSSSSGTRGNQVNAA